LSMGTIKCGASKGPRMLAGTLVEIGRLKKLSVDDGRIGTGRLGDGRLVLIGGTRTVVGGDAEGMPLSCAVAC
jgi:hypothetical protein